MKIDLLLFFSSLVWCNLLLCFILSQFLLLKLFVMSYMLENFCRQFYKVVLRSVPHQQNDVCYGCILGTERWDEFYTRFQYCLDWTKRVTVVSECILRTGAWDDICTYFEFRLKWAPSSFFFFFFFLHLRKFGCEVKPVLNIRTVFMDIVRE